LRRFQESYGLGDYDAGVLTAEQEVAEYFEEVIAAAPGASPKIVANWITGELFGLMNQNGSDIESLRVRPEALAELIQLIHGGEINQSTGKAVLAEMFATGKQAAAIVAERGLSQVSDAAYIGDLVARTLEENAEQVATYLQGKESIARWLFGQVMRAARGRANPQIVQQELDRQLNALK
jgi:aspartyl-tRNA(Asn)/glutamyl-tRNA(Gln) amidotransferase subunit B